MRRCVSSLMPLDPVLIFVDSFSNDRTSDLAQTLGAHFIQHEFSNQAKQFQWALDTLKIDTPWVMRLDADEYLEPDLQNEIAETLPSLSKGVAGIYLKRKVLFQGKWIRYGGFYPQTLLRIWRTGQARIEQRWMDEHIVLPHGTGAVTFNGHFVDDNLKGITFWIDKHNRYASREMAEALIHKYFPSSVDAALREMHSDPQARWKRILKEQFYARLPIGLRSVLYFIYRFFLRLGFLDGGRGFIWHFLQGFWYRLLVDVKIMEVENLSHGDPQKIKSILRDQHGIEI